MSSLKQIKKTKGTHQNMSRPFTIFYVNSKIPKEILTDTIMAKSNEDAQAMATAKHVDSSILYVRGIGDSEPADIKKRALPVRSPSYEQFPCARFIKGENLYLVSCI